MRSVGSELNRQVLPFVRSPTMVSSVTSDQTVEITCNCARPVRAPVSALPMTMAGRETMTLNWPTSGYATMTTDVAASMYAPGDFTDTFSPVTNPAPTRGTVLEMLEKLSTFAGRVEAIAKYGQELSERVWMTVCTLTSIANTLLPPFRALFYRQAGTENSAPNITGVMPLQSVCFQLYPGVYDISVDLDVSTLYHNADLSGKHSVPLWSSSPDLIPCVSVFHATRPELPYTQTVFNDQLFAFKTFIDPVETCLVGPVSFLGSSSLYIANLPGDSYGFDSAEFYTPDSNLADITALSMDQPYMSGPSATTTENQKCDLSLVYSSGTVGLDPVVKMQSVANDLTTTVTRAMIKPLGKARYTTRVVCRSANDIWYFGALDKYFCDGVPFTAYPKDAGFAAIGTFDAIDADDTADHQHRHFRVPPRYPSTAAQPASLSFNSLQCSYRISKLPVPVPPPDSNHGSDVSGMKHAVISEFPKVGLGIAPPVPAQPSLARPAPPSVSEVPLSPFPAREQRLVRELTLLREARLGAIGPGRD